MAAKLGQIAADVSTHTENDTVGLAVDTYDKERMLW